MQFLTFKISFNDYYAQDISNKIKIADELNRQEIEPPAVYLKIPTYIKRCSSNSNGKYV